MTNAEKSEQEGGGVGGEGGRWWGTSPLPPLVVFRSFVRRINYEKVAL